MQKSILIFFFLSISFLGNSQNIEEYYKSINQAELAIVDSNYAQAVIDYEIAFKNNLQPLGKDIYNFAICNLFENNFNKAIELFQQLVDLEYDIKNFDELKATELGKNLPKSFFQKLVELKPTGRIKLNYALRDSLQKIHDRDQYFRVKEEGYKVYADTIRKIDEYNDAELRLIIKKYGWPNEYLIGVKQSLHSGYDFEIVIWNQSTLNRISSWVDPIKEGIWHGKIEPHLGARLIEHHVGYDSYLSSPFYKFECPKCSPEIQANINGKLFYSSNVNNIEKKNEFREGIYLEKYEDFLLKYKYDRKINKYFKFLYVSGTMTYQYEKEKDMLEFLNSLSVLE